MPATAGLLIRRGRQQQQKNLEQNGETSLSSQHADTHQERNSNRDASNSRGVKNRRDVSNGRQIKDKQ